MPVPSLVSIADDVVYATSGAWLTSLAMGLDPALAAALAAGVVLLVRGLGLLTISASRYLSARADQIALTNKTDKDKSSQTPIILE